MEDIYASSFACWGRGDGTLGSSALGISCCHKHYARLRNGWQTSSATDRQPGGLPWKIDEAWTTREGAKLQHQDARIAVDSPLSMAVGLFKAVLSAGIYIGILWNVGGDLAVGVFGYVLTVPKYLVIAVATYSALLTLAMIFIGRRLVSVIAGKNGAEALPGRICANAMRLQRTL